MRMGAPSKRAKKIRGASEFSVARLATALRPPKVSGAIYSWDLDAIFSARNQQLAGAFHTPARLAESMRTDDALFVAYENRLAPQRCIRVEIKAVGGARGATPAREAEALFGQNGIGIHPDTIADIHGALVNHGVAFGCLDVVPREDGSRVDVFLRHWPIEHVRWDAQARCYKTQTEADGEVEIHHGDGRWVVFQRAEHEPHKLGAILSACIVWARHAFALRDWAKGSVAHGNVKVLGEMPEGVALQLTSGDDAGALTPEAASFLELLRSVASDDAPAGIRPAGAKTEILESKGTNWQVWKELVDNAEKAAARIYLGTDGTLGANGGAPGVDISALFGVASTKVDGDLRCIERALDTGVIEVWAALNFGDSALAPKRRYLLPDGDADAARASLATRNQAYLADLKAVRDAGVPLTQGYLDELARAYAVPPLKLDVAPLTPAPLRAVP